MANQSKAMFAEHFKNIVYNVLMGSRQKKAITGSVLFIIGFLIYMRNSSSKS